MFSWPWTPRRYTTWQSDYDGQRFISIEAFTDDELNYTAGDRILITGVTVTTGPTAGGEEFLLDSTLINGLREVAEFVPGVEYAYLVVLLPDVILDAYGAGLIAGGASWVLDTSTQTEPDRAITRLTLRTGKIVTLWTAVTDLICLLDMHRLMRLGLI